MFCIYFLHHVYYFLATVCRAYIGSKGNFAGIGLVIDSIRLGQMPAAFLSAKPYQGEAI